ncbi:uncharacterized protein LOC111061137 isoform X2 [Nilaparvata lugens]|uniref:uncharacterized protein LOC111061137 isoform X2 n=1 Tax=Nilaparvata lugens TaxID=108931 RepID=UPI00193CECDE|nr:uncharacterized protein LOC111061137 isoform X2 [Nilaparvata lugens]
MYSIALVLVLTILKNAGNSANACSLLPGGVPKCFPDAVDYETEASDSKLKEIKYRLDKKHIFGYDTNKGRRDVRLGKYWEKSIGKKSDVVQCAKDVSDNAYLPSYNTYMYDYYRDADRQVKGESPVTTLFLITKKEVWDCENTDKQIKFKRIVTEMVSREALGSIFFFDGIEVTTNPQTFQEIDNRLDMTIAREVKYIDAEDDNKVVRYDGHLKFRKTYWTNNHDSSVFKPVDGVYEEAINEQDFHQDVSNPLIEQKNYFDFSNPQGTGLEDLHRPYGQIGCSQNQARCTIQDDDKRLYKLDYLLPHWAERKFGKGGYRQHKIHPYEFTDNFIVTKHEIWSCIMLHSGEKFERQVVEYIGTKSVRTIDCFNGNKVWQYNIGDRQRGVAVRAIFYNTEEEHYQRKIYAGTLKLDEIVEEEKPKKKKSFWRLICNLFSSEEDMPEDQYKLRFDENDDSYIFNRPRS